jgi:hypothetical protein
MKLLLAGLWAWPQYEAAVADGLRSNGAEVHGLPLSGHFRGLWGRLQSAVPLPMDALWRVNREVLAAADREQPDWVFFWRPTHILPGTLRRLAGMGVRTASYNNDDPFGPHAHGQVPWHHHALWHWYIRCLPHFDMNFFYRRINCDEALARGAQHSQVLLPYFIPGQDRPVVLDADARARFGCELVFVGHHEDDGRERLVRRLIDAGIDVKLWGGASWSPAVLGDLYTRLGPVQAVLGDDYRKALCAAEICLCLLSRLNRDTYTRRCFEIPACGRVMLAERTADLTAMFKEDEEACFFSSPDELVSKAHWLLDNTERRERIAAAGLRRVWADGHAVADRCKNLLQTLDAGARH